MAAQATAPTNEHIVRLLEAVLADLAEAREREEQIARDVERLLKQRIA